MRVCHPRACAAIEGFKSFRTRTEVTLLNGFNVITGANGAGKSSFIDAISFALTETKPNRLRVCPLPPVQIRFNGARTRKTTPHMSLHMRAEYRSRDEQTGARRAANTQISNLTDVICTASNVVRAQHEP